MCDAVLTLLKRKTLCLTTISASARGTQSFCSVAHHNNSIVLGAAAAATPFLQFTDLLSKFVTQGESTKDAKGSNLMDHHAVSTYIFR